MINVLFDHQIFSMQRYGGISRYFANIYQSLNHHPDFNADISILKSNNHYIKNYPASLNNGIGDLLLKKQGRCFKWNKVFSKYKIQKGNFDVLHPTYYYPYFLKYTKKPFVITVHDMIHELFPEYFDANDPFVKYKRFCVENATHIIAISNSTKRDLQNILGIDEQRISVVHHGFDDSLSAADKKSIPDITDKDYLLFVGDRRGYKNFSRFATSVAPLLHSSSSLNLICAGGGSLLSAETELLMRLNIQHKVSQISASDQQLSALYQNAIAFVYPSLYEGFGLPILEAFQNNCPVIASDHACFREVGSDAIGYFNPYDKHDIANAIKHLINDRERLKSLVQKGQAQLLEFPMSKCIHGTMDVYRKIAG